MLEGLALSGQVPTRDELLRFSDTLLKRSIVSDKSLSAIREAINAKQIQLGAFDYLIYCPNSKQIVPDPFKRSQDPKQYILSLYLDLFAVVPDCKPLAMEVCQYNYDNKGCSGQKQEESDLIPSNLHDTAFYWWQLAPKQKAKSSKIIPLDSDCGYCITTETDLIDLINLQLNERKSIYQLAFVPSYIYRDGKMQTNNHQFGVIALTRSQGEFLGNNFTLNFQFSKMYFPKYISSTDLIARIETLKQLGLFRHLDQGLVDQSLSHVSKEPFLLVSDALMFFPNVIYTRSWHEKSGVIPYAVFVKELSRITRGEFKPKRVKDNGSKVRQQNQPMTLSFIHDGAKFKETFDDWSYGMEEIKFQLFLNTSLKQVGAKGKFYYVETSSSITNASSFIYLTETQYQAIVDKKLIPLREGRTLSQR